MVALRLVLGYLGLQLINDAGSVRQLFLKGALNFAQLLHFGFDGLHLMVVFLCADLLLFLEGKDELFILFHLLGIQ